MTFTSWPFVIFLPIVFILHWSRAGKGWQNGIIVLSSFVFYGWFDWRFCSLMALTCVMDYVLGRLIASAEGPRRLGWLTASCVINLLFLAVFKYFGFFVENVTAALARLGWSGVVRHDVIAFALPIGISFYTLQSLSYTIDVYRRHIGPCQSLIQFTAYVTFFPQLVAGPIERSTRLLPQFERAREFSYPAAIDGCRQILWGFVKKLLVADRLGALVDEGFPARGAASGLETAFAAICFSFQVYCDFSAYSDIAIGTGRLFGVSLMRNFAFPFFSTSFAEFWKRWHISLSTWFRDYVYVPLGGSRRGPYRGAANLILVFLLSGLWHGAAWNYVLWGFICAVFTLFSPTRMKGTETPGGDSRWPSVGNVIRMSTTFLLFAATVVAFRSRGLTATVGSYLRIGSDLFSMPAWQSFSSYLPAAGRYSAALLLFLTVEWTTRRQDHPLQNLERLVKSRAARWMIYTLVVWTLTVFSPTTEKPFVYFQF